MSYAYVFDEINAEAAAKIPSLSSPLLFQLLQVLNFLAMFFNKVPAGVIFPKMFDNSSSFNSFDCGFFMTLLSTPADFANAASLIFKLSQ